MKRIIITGVLLSSIMNIESKERLVNQSECANLVAYKNREARAKQQGLDNKTRAILAQFASIILGFLGIVQDPNNAANVTAHITDMVNNAVNIVTEAVKKGEILLTDITDTELQKLVRTITKRRIAHV
jgi:hypothetical protein